MNHNRRLERTVAKATGVCVWGGGGGLNVFHWCQIFVLDAVTPYIIP